MCKENRRYLFILLLGLLLSCVVGVLRAEEPDRCYLIWESELQKFEMALMNWEKDRQTWQSQASASKMESTNLNALLREERKTTLALRKSYEISETEKLTLISSKNGEIAELKEAKAAESLKAEKYKGENRTQRVIIIALSAAWVIYVGIKVYRWFIRRP